MLLYSIRFSLFAELKTEAFAASADPPLFYNGYFIPQMIGDVQQICAMHVNFSIYLHVAGQGRDA